MTSPQEVTALLAEWGKGNRAALDQLMPLVYAELYRIARQSEVVELKYFGGLTVEETAHFLRVSPETVLRDWRAAKACLYAQLTRQLSSQDRRTHTEPGHADPQDTCKAGSDDI